MLSAFIPPEVILTLGLTVAGFCILFGMVRMAGLAVAAATSAIFLPELLRVLASAIPPPLLVVVLPVAVIILIQRVVTMIFGHEAAGHVVGTLVIRLLDGTVRVALLPVQLLRRRQK
jgi:hypothetical protein